jgi:GcrA cell cycle regulator
MNIGPSAWTDDNVTKLKSLFVEGLSASEIAARLPGAFTRNAVIGKLTRLNLEKRPRPPRASKEAMSIVRDRQVRVAKLPAARDLPHHTILTSSPPCVGYSKPAAPPRPVVIEEPKPTGEITILHLTRNTCRWPIGDVGRADFHFCGHPPRDEKTPYCPYHAKKAAAAIQPKPFTASAFRNGSGRAANAR